MITKHFPTPSDRMGFLWTLTSIEDCFAIEFGPAGTTHFAIEGIMELGAEHKLNVYTTHLSEVDITFGKHDKLAGAIREVNEKYAPKYIFIMASSVTALIGIDIESICMLMQPEVKSKLIPVTYGGYDGDYNLGIERALLSICKNIVKEKKSEDGLYNIIGSNIDSYNFEADKTEIVTILKETFGLRVNACLTAYTSVSEIEQLAKAKYNIVLRKEGLKCAEYLQEKFGIPYVYKKPYGPSETIIWLGEIAKKFDLKINMNYVEEQTAKIEMYMAQYKMYLRTVENKSVVINGEYDTAIGMKELLTEFGLSCDHVFIKHFVDEKIEGAVIKPSENEIKSAIDRGYYAAFGDDTVRKFCKDKDFFQIANPNMEKYNFYPLTPLVGFNGSLKILQDLINLERARRKE